MAAGQHIASGFKHPDSMARKDKLEFIKYLKKSDRESEAWVFYLRHGAGISQKKFKEA